MYELEFLPNSLFVAEAMIVNLNANETKWSQILVERLIRAWWFFLELVVLLQFYNKRAPQSKICILPILWQFDMRFRALLHTPKKIES